jgi:hypothetical protein
MELTSVQKSKFYEHFYSELVHCVKQSKAMHNQRKTRMITRKVKKFWALENGEGRKEVVISEKEEGGERKVEKEESESGEEEEEEDEEEEEEESEEETVKETEDKGEIVKKEEGDRSDIITVKKSETDTKDESETNSSQKPTQISKRREAKYFTKVQTAQPCTICGTETTPSTIITTSCTHPFHIKCFQNYLTKQTQTHTFKIFCPKSNCHATFPKPHIKSNLPASAWKTFTTHCLLKTYSK